MIEGLYISASGMLPKGARHETIANNLANLEVPGFKRDNLFLREMGEAKKRLSGDYPAWRINRLEGAWTDFSQGKLRQTNNMFNIAINGKGFFAVQTPEGVQYTRNGNFSKSADGTLVTPLGYPVLDEGGNNIVVSDNFREPIIEAGGVIKGRDELLGIDQVIATLQIVDFPELYDQELKAQTPFQPVLNKGRDGYFVPQPNAQQVPAAGYELSQGFLENANVEAVLEMVKMIDVFRGYEADQRAIQVQDQTLDRAVNEVGSARS